MAGPVGWKDPGQNKAQLGALHSMRRWNYLIGGRGVGKTAFLCIRAFMFACAYPGLMGLITEQTAGMINEVLAPCWKRIIGDGGGVCKLQHNNFGFEVRFINSSVILFRSRHAKNTIDDPPFHGQTVGYLGHDELSLDRRTDVITVSAMMVRQEHTPLIIDIAATPRRNWLYSHCMSKGLVAPGSRKIVSDDGHHAIFYGPTSENAYNRNLHDRMIGEISDKEARQYLYGEWVDLEDLVWTQFKEELFPNGNIIDDGGFKHGQPYILSIDHGDVDASWGLWQARGNGAYSRVAEYTPHGVMGIQIAREIQLRYGKPARIMAGTDHTSGGRAGISMDHVLMSMGWIPAERVTGDRADKEMQGNILARQLCNTNGQRKILISKQMQCHYPGKTRGALDLFRGDTWPDTKHEYYFRKEKSKQIFHEDTRDDILYFCVQMWPPVWAEYTNWAAA